MTKITYIPGEIANAAIDEHGNRKPVTRTQHIFDDAEGKSQSQVNQERIEQEATLDNKIATEKQRAEVVEGGLNTRLETVEQLAEISIGGGDAQIATGSDFTNPDATKRAKVPTVGAIVDGLNDGVYDVSKRNPTAGPNSDGKFTLEYILSNADALIPTGWRHGGMTISFVQSSDNKYVQYKLMADEWSTDTDDWSISGVIIVKNNPEWLFAITDSLKNVLIGIRKSGAVDWNIGIPKPIQKVFDSFYKRSKYLVYFLSDVNDNVLETIEKSGLRRFFTNIKMYKNLEVYGDLVVHGKIKTKTSPQYIPIPDDWLSRSMNPFIVEEEEVFIDSLSFPILFTDNLNRIL